MAEGGSPPSYPSGPVNSRPPGAPSVPSAPLVDLNDFQSRFGMSSSKVSMPRQSHSVLNSSRGFNQFTTTGTASGGLPLFNMQDPEALLADALVTPGVGGLQLHQNQLPGDHASFLLSSNQPSLLGLPAPSNIDSAYNSNTYNLEEGGSELSLTHLNLALKRKGMEALAAELLELAGECGDNEDLRREMVTKVNTYLRRHTSQPDVLENKLHMLFEKIREKLHNEWPMDLRGFRKIGEDQLAFAAENVRLQIMSRRRRPVDFALARSGDTADAAIEAMKFEKKVRDANPHSAIRLNKYLGQGTFGTVYRVRFHHRGRKTDFVKKEFNLPERFDPNEIRMTCHLPLDKLCVPHTLGCLAGKIFLLCDYKGAALNKAINKIFPLTSQVTCQFVAQMLYDLCHQLKELHAKERVHKDIKPANVLVHKQGSGYQFWLIDFGGCVASIGPPNYKDHVRSATPAYMAPEVAKIHLAGADAFKRAHVTSPDSNAALDESFTSRTAEIRPNPSYDIWCLGLLVYYCQERSHPFLQTGTTNKEDLLRTIVSHPEIPLKAIEEGVKSNKNEFVELLGLVSSMLDTNPERRNNAAYYLSELQTLFGDTLRVEQR